MTSPRHVLVADDNDDMCRLLQLLMKSDGYRVSIAHDGEEALLMLTTGLPDLAVLDVAMPHLSGVEVSLAARADARTAGIPIILHTGFARDANMDQALKLPRIHYRMKGGPARDLLGFVRYLLNQPATPPEG